jgi:hypothetical protein
MLTLISGVFSCLWGKKLIYLKKLFGATNNNKKTSIYKFQFIIINKSAKTVCEPF